MDIVQAPWTPKQVEALNRWQDSGWVHPFTCGPCRDGATKRGDGDEQYALVATTQGWVCPTCDYTQDWAHRMMTELRDKPPWS